MKYKMDLLPYELQFKYLITVPYKDVGKHCLSSMTASKILTDNWFWRKKTKYEFGYGQNGFHFPFGLWAKRLNQEVPVTALEKYLLLEKVWELHPAQFIKVAIRKDHHSSLICLLNRLKINNRILEEIWTEMIESATDKTSYIIFPRTIKKVLQTIKTQRDIDVIFSLIIKYGIRALMKSKWNLLLLMGIYSFIMYLISYFLSKHESKRTDIKQ